MWYSVLNKKDVEFIVINNNCGFEVILADLGASIYSIKYHQDMMTMTPIVIDDFKSDKLYYGKTVGRIAGRVKDAKINVEGITYNLQANEGTTSLHGGPHGLYTKTFKGKVKQLEDKIIVTYTYLSKDLEEGYPGNANIDVIYTIYKDIAKIDINFLVTVDKTCPISITNHSYFCLGEKSLKDCKLKIKADKFIEVDPNSQIPLKERLVPDFMNFNEFKDILKDINEPYLMDSKSKGYDHYFIFKDRQDQISLKGHRYQMDITTDMDGVQIYTHNYMDNIITMASGALIYRGIAIEPQLHQLKDNLLKPNQTFKKVISYTFKEI